MHTPNLQEFGQAAIEKWEAGGKQELSIPCLTEERQLWEKLLRKGHIMGYFSGGDDGPNDLRIHYHCVPEGNFRRLDAIQGSGFHDKLRETRRQIREKHVGTDPDEQFRWFPLFRKHLPPRLDRHMHHPQTAVARQTVESWRYDLFISYRHASAEMYAQALAKDLRKDGFSVFCAGDFDLPAQDEKKLLRILTDALEHSAGLVLVGCDDPLGGDWTRWEMDVFIEGRYGMCIPLLTKDINPNDHANFRLMSQYWCQVFYEERDHLWETGEPSLETFLNVCTAISFFKVLLRVQRYIERVPPERRRETLLRCIEHNFRCRHYMGAMYHWLPGFSMGLEWVRPGDWREDARV